MELVVQSLCSGHKDIRQVKRSRSASTIIDGIISVSTISVSTISAATICAAAVGAAVSRDKVVLKVVDVDTVTHPIGGEAFVNTTMAGLDFDTDWIIIGPDNERVISRLQVCASPCHLQLNFEGLTSIHPHPFIVIYLCPFETFPEG